MSQLNRPTVKTRNSSAAAGIDKHLPSPVAIDGTTMAPADLKAVFTQHTAALDAADALHKQWTDQLQVASDAGKKATRTFGLLRSVVIGQFGDNANAVLNDFGMTAPKPRGPKTVEAKALASDRRAATRLARHTMGKVQKKKVTWASRRRRPRRRRPRRPLPRRARRRRPSRPRRPRPRRPPGRRRRLCHRPSP